MSENSVIQKAIATLITHPCVVENYNDFRDNMRSMLNLNNCEMVVLDDFYQNNKERFTASTRILKKNRWDDIKLSLPIMVGHINQNKLNNIWDDYIGQNHITELVPKNPLIESIIFATFAEAHSLATPLEREVTRYERIRNEVTCSHHEDFSDYAIDYDVFVDEAGMNKLSIFVHQCYRIELFEYDIPRILSQHPIKNSSAVVMGNHTILFYKNLNKEGIGTLKISSDIASIIKQAVVSGNLLTAYAYYQKSIDPYEFMKLLIKLKEVGVLRFLTDFSSLI